MGYRIVDKEDHLLFGVPMTIKCEVHDNCKEPAVAKINLPGPHSQWACIKGFNEWRAKQASK